MTQDETYTLETTAWYRIADFQPSLRHHVRIHRQVHRGELAYVLQDRSSGRYHLLTPEAYFLVSLMDGQSSVQSLWDRTCAQFPDAILTQQDVLRLLATLHAADVLRGDVPGDVKELSHRGERQAQRRQMMRFLNPLAIRVPLLDPDRFLEATLPLLRPVFSVWGALAYVLLLGFALVQAGANWELLSENVADRVLTGQNLLITLLVYPLVKAVHELGHGYAVKHGGGEVHEIGVLFLVFMPVPYVDASAAAAFPGKWQRALVGAAGILVELLLASLALLVWLAAEDGLLRACAYSVMLIGGISTLFFNGNPLLRFDGYYVLQDLIEIPNLGTRANRYIGWLVKTRLLRVQDADSPLRTQGEGPWLVGYGVLSFLYRLFIMAAIVLFVATRFFVIGVMLAIWSVCLMLGLPLLKQLRYLASSTQLRGLRLQAIGRVAAVLLVVTLLLLAVPMPYSTVAEGVVWVSEESTVHALSEGFVDEVYVTTQQSVDAGDRLVSLKDPLLDSEVDIQAARVRELELRAAERTLTNRVDARVVEQQLRHARADLALAEERRQQLSVTADAAGRVAIPQADDMPGQFVNRGAVLGYIIDPARPVVRVALDEDQIGPIRENLREVRLRAVTRMADSVQAAVKREVPALSDTLPSLALSAEGGGRFVLDPTDTTRHKVLGNIYTLDVVATQPWQAQRLGERVYVKFVHDWEPVGWRLLRTVRRVFLRQLNV